MSPQGYEKKVFAYSIPTVVLSDQKHLLGKSLKRNQGTDLLVACCIFCLFDQGCYFSSDMLHYRTVEKTALMRDKEDVPCIRSLFN